MSDFPDIRTLASPINNRSSSETVVVSGGSAETPDPSENRYALIGLIAAGGMGAVYRAWDDSLQRDVAIKMIHDFYADPANIRRFRNEATISAQLQHPGIPPIYDLGSLPDGKPFLAMKLVEGRTLESLIRDGRATLDVTGVFEAIAQAIGYAHSRGVIHRDLKPSNVMVGSFGEVQVMDWGLAKVLAGKRPEPAEWHRTHRPTPDVSSGTVVGCAMGTPAYMPPEQATGSLEKVNEASDVFGLGGILCAMLTGQAPFDGTDAESTRELAAKGALGGAYRRLDESGAEPALVALAKRCLSADPANRPANGDEVARIVAKLRVDADNRAEQAQLARAVSEARQRLRTRAAAAVIGILIAGVAASLWLTRRAELAEESARAQLVKTAEAEGVAKEKTREVEAALAVVAERTELALDAFQRLVGGVQDKLDNRPGTQELRKELLLNGRAGLLKILENSTRQARPDRTLFVAHMNLGDLEQSLGNTAAAAAEYRAGHEMVRRLIAADETGRRYANDLILSYSRLGDVTLKLGKEPEALEHFRKGHELALKALRDKPGDGGAAFHRNALASRLLDQGLDPGDGLDGLEFYRRILGDFEKLAGSDPEDAHDRRNLGAVHFKMGDAWLARGRAQDAFECFQKGAAIFQKLADADPDNPNRADDLCSGLGRLGDAKAHLNQIAEARQYYERKRDLSQRLAAVDPKNVAARRALAVSHEKLGNLALAEKNRPEALKLYLQSATQLQQLSDADPTNRSALTDLAILYDKLGLVSHDGGRTAASLEYRHKAVDEYQKLVDTDPANGRFQRELSNACERLGETQLRAGRAPDALATYERLRSIEEALAKAKPENVETQKLLAGALNRLGDTALVLGRRDRAADYFRQALDLRNRLAERHPTDLSIRREMSVSYNRLGNMAVEDGKLNAALDYFSREMALSEELVKADPSNRADRRDHVVSCERLGFISFKLGRWKDAREHWLRFQKASRELAESDPTNGGYVRLVSLSSIRLGEVAHRLGEAAKTDELFRHGLDVNRQLCAADSENIQWCLDRFSACEKYALVHYDRLDFEKAIEWFGAARDALFPWQEKKRLVGPSEKYIGFIDVKIAYCRAVIEGSSDLESIFRNGRSNVLELLVDCMKVRLKRKEWDGAVAAANRFAAWAERQDRDVAEHRYNAACVYAQCAVPDGTGMDRSLALLRQLLAGGYFTAQRIDHLKKDGDFDGIRAHPKFAAFLTELEKSREIAPPPRELRIR